MAEPSAAFVDVAGLWGPGWQACPIQRQETGDFVMRVRLGANGLVEPVTGVSRDDVIRRAGEHAAAVNRLLKGSAS